jgi:hypothetical protein
MGIGIRLHVHLRITSHQLFCAYKNGGEEVADRTSLPPATLVLAIHPRHSFGFCYASNASDYSSLAASCSPRCRDCRDSRYAYPSTEASTLSDDLQVLPTNPPLRARVSRMSPDWSRSVILLRVVGGFELTTAPTHMSRQIPAPDSGSHLLAPTTPTRTMRSTSTPPARPSSPKSLQEILSRSMAKSKSTGATRTISISPNSPVRPISLSSPRVIQSRRL